MRQYLARKEEIVFLYNSSRDLFHAQGADFPLALPPGAANAGSLHINKFYKNSLPPHY
jgi:hypothetical protein